MRHNICCFTRVTFAHAAKGGMELHTRTLSEALVRRGHEVTILTTSLEPMCEMHRMEKGVSIHYLPVTQPGRYSPEFWQNSAARFQQLHSSARFDVAWSEGLGAVGYINSVARDDRAPLFSILQGSIQGTIATIFRAAPNKAKGLYSVFRSMPMLVNQYLSWHRPLYRASEVIVCPSPQNRREIERESWAARSRLFTSINGIDVDTFRPDKALGRKGRRRLELDDGDHLILNVGRITSDKGIDVLLRAVDLCRTRIPRPVVVIAGVGGDRPRLEILARKLGLSDIVRFVGFVPNEDLPMYYNACNLFVCPTVRVESFGIVLAEAMACSRPVVSSATGGTRYVIEDGKSGILVPPRDAHSLAKAIMLLHDQRRLAERLGVNGRDRALKYLSTDRMVDDTEIVIQRALAAGPGPTTLAR